MSVFASSISRVDGQATSIKRSATFPIPRAWQSGPVLAGRETGRLLVRSEPGYWAEVWIANADGSGLRQATTLHASELLIGSWSPDSRRMVIDAAIAGDSTSFSYLSTVDHPSK